MMMIIYERKKLYLVLASQQPSLNSRVLPSRFIWDFLNNFSSSTLSSLSRSSSRSTARDGRVCILWLNCCLVIVPVPVGHIRKRKKGGPFEYYTFTTSMLICDLKHQNQNVLSPFPKRFPHSFFILLLVGVLFIALSTFPFIANVGATRSLFISYNICHPPGPKRTTTTTDPTTRHDTARDAQSQFSPAQDPTYVHVS